MTNIKIEQTPFAVINGITSTDTVAAPDGQTYAAFDREKGKPHRTKTMSWSDVELERVSKNDFELGKELLKLVFSQDVATWTGYNLAICVDKTQQTANEGFKAWCNKLRIMPDYIKQRLSWLMYNQSDSLQESVDITLSNILEEGRLKITASYELLADLESKIAAMQSQAELVINGMSESMRESMRDSVMQGFVGQAKNELLSQYKINFADFEGADKTIPSIQTKLSTMETNIRAKETSIAKALSADIENKFKEQKADMILKYEPVQKDAATYMDEFDILKLDWQAKLQEYGLKFE